MTTTPAPVTNPTKPMKRKVDCSQGEPGWAAMRFGLQGSSIRRNLSKTQRPREFLQVIPLQNGPAWGNSSPWARFQRAVQLHSARHLKLWRQRHIGGRAEWCNASSTGPLRGSARRIMTVKAQLSVNKPHEQFVSIGCGGTPERIAPLEESLPFM